MSRLRHLGWGEFSRGLTSRPLESCHHQCLKAVCGVLGYPSGAAAELLDGTLTIQPDTLSNALGSGSGSSKKHENHCGRSKASLTEHHGKCLTCKSFVLLGFCLVPP